MGGVAKTVGNAFSNPVRALTAVGTFGTSELARKMGSVPQYIASLPENIANSLLGTKYGQTGTPNIGGSGPFNLDPNQLAGDQAAITGEGQKQYQQTLSGIDANTGAQQKLAADTFKQMLPGIAEDYNAGHLLNSTGYQSEAARQASQLANQVAAESSQQKLQALGGMQGFQTGALQRQTSLEDFINQANVAKTIGAQMAPQPASGKQNFGAVAQGVGALAPWAKVGKA